MLLAITGVVDGESLLAVRLHSPVPGLFGRDRMDASWKRSSSRRYRRSRFQKVVWKKLYIRSVSLGGSRWTAEPKWAFGWLLLHRRQSGSKAMVIRMRSHYAGGGTSEVTPEFSLACIDILRKFWRIRTRSFNDQKKFRQQQSSARADSRVVGNAWMFVVIGGGWPMKRGSNGKRDIRCRETVWQRRHAGRW